MIGRVAAEEAPPPVSAPEADAPILVVDDHAAKRLTVRTVLEPLGHTIVEAESGEAALREVMNRSFAVILLDVQMPGMDGYETARLIRMRAESEGTPIIFVTAHSSEEAQIAVGYASGAIDFIFAPIFPDILRAKVTIFIELFLKSRAPRAHSVRSKNAQPTLPRQRDQDPLRAQPCRGRDHHGRRRGRDRIVQPCGDGAAGVRGARGDRSVLCADNAALAVGRVRQS